MHNAYASGVRGGERLTWAELSAGGTSANPEVRRSTRLACLAKPGRQVAAGVQDAPDVDVVALLEVEDQVRKPANGPEPQVRRVQRVAVTQRAGRGMERNVGERAFEEWR